VRKREKDGASFANGIEREYGARIAHMARQTVGRRSSSRSHGHAAISTPLRTRALHPDLATNLKLFDTDLLRRSAGITTGAIAGRGTMYTKPQKCASTSTDKLGSNYRARVLEQ